MRRLIVCLFLLLPISGFAFDVAQLKECSAVMAKKFTKSDSMDVNRYIQASKAMVDIFGVSRVDVKANYVYQGAKTIEVEGDASWRYFYPPSYGGGGKGKLIYNQNEVMRAGRAGDALVIGKCKNEILLLIVQQDSPAEQELYSVLGMSAPTPEKTSLWRRLWGTAEKRTADYEIDTAALPMPTIPEKSWARIYFTPGPECEDNIVASIDDATRAIDVAVYSITNDKIVDSLLAAHRRGVRVRIISDRLQASGRHSLISRLADAGVPVILNKKHKIMHHKFAIFDKKDIETGSYNWTSSATQSNAENCMFFPEQRKEFTNQFKYLWDFYQG